MIWKGRRGKAVTINSRTGHGAEMGIATGKVLDYRTRCKNCRVCELAKKNEKDP